MGKSIAVVSRKRRDIQVESFVEIVGFGKYWYILPTDVMRVWHGIYKKLITKENIFRGYREFLKGKKKKKDVVKFAKEKNKNLSDLQMSLLNKSYQPGGYSQFLVHDPKTRIIHKASVRDRVVHHIVSDVLVKIFEPTFIAHSYSCRKGKGTHKGVVALQKMALKVSRNDTKTCWVLKSDISKFFASINHKILLRMLKRKIEDEDFCDLLTKIVDSFYSDKTVDLNDKKGIPIGNLTSQFFSNVYLNELDRFIKHDLRVTYYVRYADDFVIVDNSRDYLLSLVDPIQKFLKSKLDLELHPGKITTRKFISGIDFLGYIIFPSYILPRTKTKRRLIRKIRHKIGEFKQGKITEETLNQTIQSYYGFLTHAHAYEFKKELQNLIWFWLTE